VLTLQRPPEGYNVAVHHTWSAEVESYRTHHWKVRVIDRFQVAVAVRCRPMSHRSSGVENSFALMLGVEATK